jgi:hypothetical protein
MGLRKVNRVLEIFLVSLYNIFLNMKDTVNYLWFAMSVSH